MHPDCVFGGYALYRGQEPEKAQEALYRVYTGMEGDRLSPDRNSPKGSTL